MGSKYVPDVKNWSNREEVNDAFFKKYAGSHAKDAKSNFEPDGKSDEKDNAVESLYATSQSSDNLFDASSSSVPTHSKGLAFVQRSGDATSQDTADAQGAMKTSSLSTTSAHKSTYALLVIPTSLTAGAVAILYGK